MNNCSNEDVVKKFLGYPENLKTKINPNIKPNLQNITVSVDLSVENFDDYISKCSVGMRTTNYIQQSIQYYFG